MYLTKAFYIWIYMYVWCPMNLSWLPQPYVHGPSKVAVCEYLTLYCLCAQWIKQIFDQSFLIFGDYGAPGHYLNLNNLDPQCHRTLNTNVCEKLAYYRSILRYLIFFQMYCSFIGQYLHNINFWHPWTLYISHFMEHTK